MNLVVKEIKKLVSCGLITLIGFNFFIGCSSPMEPEEISSIVFELNTQMVEDGNGYYHLTIDETKWQTLHRISGNVYRDGHPMNVTKFAWSSNFYWIIGDNFGYFICNTGLNDNGTYVGYDTTYVDWFNGAEVPIVNSSSYSDENGEVNTMIAPVRTMIGDTATIFYGYYDEWKGEETIGEFHIIFD